MILKLLFTLGIVVEAITGTIAAGRKQVDVFGVIIIACVTALGGGTIRDIILDTYPLIWVTTPFYLWLACLSAIFTIAFTPSVLKWRKLFLILDALGLATFAVIGTQKAMSYHFPISVCIVSGMLTGICGGMLRDILCNGIPLVLRKEIYALVALLGSSMYLGLTYTALPHSITIAVSILAMFSARVYAILYEVEMPIYEHSN